MEKGSCRRRFTFRGLFRFILMAAVAVIIVGLVVNKKNISSKLEQLWSNTLPRSSNTLLQNADCLTRSMAKQKPSPQIMKEDPGCYNDSLINCVTIESEKKWQLCIHSPERDIWVSKPMINGRLYEREAVDMFIRFTEKYPQAGLLDIGANVGIYTVQMAVLGKPVVAIEPVDCNYKRLLKGLHLNQVESKVCLLPFAIGDTPNTAVKIYHPETDRNQASMRVKAAEHLQPGQALKDGFVRSITLSDVTDLFPTKVAILKIDAQFSECRILAHFDEFVSKIFVPYLYMEWELRVFDKKQDLPVYPLCVKEEYQVMAYKINALGYYPLDPFDKVKLEVSQATQWKRDYVLWVHNTAYYPFA